MENSQQNPFWSGEYQPVLKQRYEVKKKLGEGGFAETFLAYDQDRSAHCVLKILSWKDVPDWKVIELFEREARVLSQMDHPQIPRFIEFFTEEIDSEKKIVLVQEYISGKNLAEFIREGKHFTEKEVLSIGLVVTKILEYLHDFSPAIIHRDIKPSNLLASEDGELHLVDFGAVRDKVLHYQKTEAGGFTVVGTYGYMPFEQFQGQAVPASDIYSLGMTLITLLSHKEPAEMELTGSDLDFAPYVNVSEAFKSVLKKMIAHRLEDRYVSAKALRQDLEALLAGKQPQVIESRAKKISSGTLVALLLVFFVAMFAFVKETRQPGPAQRTTPIVQKEKPVQFPPYTGITVRGKVLFDGKPITETTNLQPKFWFRDEKKGTEASAETIYSNGEFEIRGLAPGQYGIGLQFDTNQSNPISYPGDLRAWERFTVSENSNSVIQVEPLQIIHLIKPEDNGRVLQDWNRCCEEGKPAHPEKLKLQWTSMGENVFYDYTISRLGCPYQTLDSVASGTTQETSIALNLPASNSKEYYLLQIYARKDGRRIGMLMTHGANGYGWDYRFRIQ
ncbi:protein kinase [bacterium]|nr:protein kinase [bacterium]